MADGLAVPMLDKWLMPYYERDPLVQRVVKEARHQGHDAATIYRTLLEQLLLEREQQRATAAKALQARPFIPAIPAITDWTQDLGDGYTLVPMSQMTANGLFLPHLPVTLPITRWAVIGPNGKALQSDTGHVFNYHNPDMARDDIEFLKSTLKEA